MTIPVHIRPIHNRPTVPESSPRHQGGKVPPVTRRDLGTDFRAYMKLETNDWRTSVMFDAIRELDLATVTMLQWYGSVEVRDARADPALAGLAGLLYVSRYGIAQNETATGFEMQTVAAAVLGGVNIIFKNNILDG